MSDPEPEHTLLERACRALMAKVYNRGHSGLDKDCPLCQAYIAADRLLSFETGAPLSDEVRSWDAAQSQSAGVTGWQPIKVAPKDGTEVLVYVPRRLGAIVAQASNVAGGQWWGRNMGDVNPTHWMPLPPPPTSPTQQDRREA